MCSVCVGITEMKTSIRYERNQPKIETFHHYASIVHCNRGGGEGGKIDFLIPSFLAYCCWLIVGRSTNRIRTREKNKTNRFPSQCILVLLIQRQGTCIPFFSHTLAAIRGAHANTTKLANFCNQLEECFRSPPPSRTSDGFNLILGFSLCFLLYIYSLITIIQFCFLA